MALKCPKTTDPNWDYAIDRLNNNYDELLYLYYKLGDRIPSNGEVDAYVKGYSLTAVNNQRSWDVENTNDGILRKDNRWKTLPSGKKQKLFKRHTEQAANKLIINLNKKYSGSSITFFKVPVKYVENGKTLNRWELRVKDNMFRHAENDQIFRDAAAEIRRTMEGLEGSQQAMDEGQYEVVDGEIVTRPTTTRLYRAEVEKGVDSPAPSWLLEQPEVKTQQEAEGRWFYKSLPEAQEHAKKFGSSGISYVDVPTSELDSFNAKDNKFAGGYGREGNEYFISKEYAETRKPIETNKPTSSVYNKQQVADLMVADLPVETKEIMREEFIALPRDEFNAMAKSIGLNNLGNYWTASTIYEAVEEPETEIDTVVEERIAYLKSKFPIGTEVIQDTTIVGIAQLDGKNSSGDAIIRINPKKLGEDTLGHEFGHILIDLLGGMSNTMVRVGRQQLVGTNVEADVIAAYPEHAEAQDDRLDKEILATAVGTETAKLFAEEEKRTKFEKWLVRFLRALRIKLGLEISVAKELAQRLVYDEIAIRDEEIQGEISEYDQASKDLKNNESILNTLIDKQTKFREEAIKVLEQKIGIYERRDKGKEAVKALKATLSVVRASDPTSAMLQFMRSAIQNTYSVKGRMDRAKSNLRKGKSDITPRDLDNWRTYVSAYDMLENYRQALLDAKEDMSLFGTEEDKAGFEELLRDTLAVLTYTKTEFSKNFKEISDGIAKNDKLYNIKSKTIIDEILPMLDLLIQHKNSIKDFYWEHGKKIMVDYLMPYVTVVEAEYREIEEKKFRAIPYEQRKGQKFEDVWLSKLTDLREEITEKTRERIAKELEIASGDIGILSRHLDTVLDSPDVVASAIAKAYVIAQDKNRKEVLAERYDFIDRVEALEKQLGRSFTTADESFFNFMLEQDLSINGNPYTQYLVSPVPSRLKQDYENYMKSISGEHSGKDNTGKKYTPSQIRKMSWEWKNKNAPRIEEDWFQARKDFLLDLKEKGEITTKEFEEWQKNEGRKYQYKKTNAQIFGEDSIASRELSHFEYANTWNYRKLSPYYQKLNAKWEALEAMRNAGFRNGKQTDERIIFYDFIIDRLTKAERLLPGKYRLGYKLPGVVKSMGDRMRANQGVFKSIKQEYKDKLQQRGSDTEKGTVDEEGRVELVNEANEPVYLLPIHYVNKVDLQDQSFDIATIYFNYLRMSMEFDTLYDLQAPFEMAQQMIKRRKYVKQDSTGKKIRNALSKSKDENDEQFLTIEGSQAHTTQQYTDFLKMNLYGMRKAEERDWNILGVKVNQAKFLDGINQYTGLNLLGFNVIQGLANVNLGEIMQAIEARAGEYYGTKNLHKATMKYYANLGSMLNDVGKRKPSNFINLLNDAYDTLNDYTGGKINKNSRFRELFQTDSAFFLAHAGEHYMQTRVLLAMLDTIEAKDKDGKVLGTMLEMYSAENGRLVLNPEVVNFDAERQGLLKAKVKRVLARLHGEYSREGMSAIQMYALGRMSIMFRKFIVPGAKRRWQGKRYNELLGEYTEGNYITFARVLPQIMKDLMKMKFDLLSRNRTTLTAAEYANVIRTLNEAVALASVIILTMLATRAMDDDDENLWWLNHMAYQALRLRSELAFFLMPTEAMKILRSPMASMAMFENVLKLFGDLTHPLLSGTLQFEVYQQGPWKDHYKIEKTLVQAAPGLKQVYRIRDVKDQISWFK